DPLRHAAGAAMRQHERIAAPPDAPDDVAVARGRGAALAVGGDCGDEFGGGQFRWGHASQKFVGNSIDWFLFFRGAAQRRARKPYASAEVVGRERSLIERLRRMDSWPRAT